MPHSLSARKAQRKAEKARLRNRAVRTSVKTRVTRAEKLIQEKDLVAATAAVREAIRALDRASKKGVIHDNTAARSKSRLMTKMNAAQMPETPRRRAKKAETASTSE